MLRQNADWTGSSVWETEGRQKRRTREEQSTWRGVPISGDLQLQCKGVGEPLEFQF